MNEGSILYYLRGGTSNTTSYDNEYITFNADHTGVEVNNIAVSTQYTNVAIVIQLNTKLTMTFQVSLVTNYVSYLG